MNSDKVSICRPDPPMAMPSARQGASTSSAAPNSADLDVMGFLLPCQPVQVRPHRMEGIEGHHGALQVHGFQEFGEMAGLVVLDVDLEVVQEAPAMFSGAEKMDTGAVGAAGSAGGLAVHGDGAVRCTSATAG